MFDHKFFLDVNVIGLAARNKFCTIPSRAKDEVLGQKPKRGRPKLFRSFLVRD